MRVIGVDGAPGGWVWVELDRGAATRVGFAAALADVPDAEVVGIDIPIGFPAPGRHRPAEVAARRLLGRRASSVFAVPPRAVLEAADYAEARRVAVELTGRSVSAQTFALAPRILEAADAERRGAPLVEVHPEAAFATLAGEAVGRKKTWDGQEQRRMLLAAEGVVVTGELGAAGSAAPDDVLDAAVCALVADRHRRGEATPLAEPTDPEDRPIWV